MGIKKLLSFAIVASQISLGGAMAGAGDATPTRSPEFTLLEQVAAIQGEKISNKDYRDKIKAEIASYNNVAPADGREARISEALVEGNFMTADRAQSFVATINNQLSTAQNTPNLDEKQVQNLVASSVYNGAQLSGCGYHRDLGVFLVAGGIISLPFIAHYAESGLSSFAENWSFAGASLGIVTGAAIVTFNRHCR